MNKRSFLLLGGLASSIALVFIVAPAAAELDPGRYRIYRMNNTYVEGEVKELPDGSYQVSVGIGKVILRKNEVKRIVPLEEVKKRQTSRRNTGPAEPTNDYRPYVADDEIEAVLSGITAEYDPTIRGGTVEELMAPLPVDEESVEDMKRLMGPKAKILHKDHFTMAYTSTDESARALGSRLEAVWRHNVNFMDRLKLPAIVPDSKMEIFYFGSQKEFELYSMNQGNPLPSGVLGYYSPDWNRSHFFDMWNSAYTANIKAMLDDPDVDWKVKRKQRNQMERWVEFKNMEVIQHEIGHHIHFNIGLFPRDSFGGGGVPIWLVEGTTMLFEVPPSSAGGSIGLLNHYRLFMLRGTWGFHPMSPDEWKLFLIDNNLWRGFNSYQLGWSMVYYLYMEHREGYGEYLRNVFGRDTGYQMTPTERQEEFESIFGKIDEEWIDDFYMFLDGLYVRKSLLPPDLQEQFTPAVNERARELLQQMKHKKKNDDDDDDDDDGG